MYNSVEQELWRIFTFYSLHGDPNQPEIMRPANFLRFAKDCQITSKKLTPTQIELEITRLVSVLRHAEKSILTSILRTNLLDAL